MYSQASLVWIDHYEDRKAVRGRCLSLEVHFTKTQKGQLRRSSLLLLSSLRVLRAGAFSEPGGDLWPETPFSVAAGHEADVSGFEGEELLVLAAD